METTSESTDQGIHFDGNPSPFPPFRNIGAPYMATLSLPGLTIGLPVWLFSNSLVQNIAISLQSSTPPTGKNQPLVDLKVGPFLLLRLFLPLRLVKVLLLVTRWLRRRIKERRRRRRRKFSRGATKKPLL